MDYLWTTYGLPMEQHRARTVAIPCQPGVPRARGRRQGFRGFDGCGLDRRRGVAEWPATGELEAHRAPSWRQQVTGTHYSLFTLHAIC